MIITKKALPRRTMLRGMGTVLALPLLDAMVPALSASSKTEATPVRRLSVVYVPNGMAMEYWTPAAEGAAFEFTPILKPLAPFRDRLLVLTGLDGSPDAAHREAGGGHGGASTVFLTGSVAKDTEAGAQAGISIDQFIAKQFGQQTQLASLECALDSRDNTGTCDMGLSCTFHNTISWRTPTTPLPMENNPRVVFTRLFGDSGSTDPSIRRVHRRRDQSILDSVTETAADLERGLGPEDRGKISQYLEAVRDSERRIQKAEQQQATELPAVAQPAGIPASYEDHAKLMFDLQVLAFQSDLTRVISFMVGREFSGRTYPQIGVPEAHHPLSHHQYDPVKVATMAKLNAYHVSLLAYYIEKLRSTPDGDGSLLDHVLMMYGGGMSDSNAHSHRNLPILLVGGASGQLKGGRHVQCADAPSGNLLVTITDKLGVPLEQLGNSRGKLDIETLSGI